MTFRSIKEHGTTPKAFEREFALEILKSDKLRVTILIGVILSALLIVLIGNRCEEKGNVLILTVAASRFKIN